MSSQKHPYPHKSVEPPALSYGRYVLHDVYGGHPDEYTDDPMACPSWMETVAGSCNIFSVQPVGRADADIAPSTSMNHPDYEADIYARAARQVGHLPTDAARRKALPIATGVLDYFPDALAAVAHASKVGNDQHSPGQPLHWAKDKSTDEADCLIRHFLERGTLDTDGVRHSAKVAWRALAMLQREIEAAGRV